MKSDQLLFLPNNQLISAFNKPAPLQLYSYVGCTTFAHISHLAT